MTMENSAPIRVFLIDDHRSILWGLERLIDSGKPAMQVVGSAVHVGLDSRAGAIVRA